MMDVEKLLEKNDVRSNYSFVYEENDISKVICRCGNKFEKEIRHDDRLTEAEAETLSDVKEALMLSTHEKLKCQECGTNFFIQEERARLIPIGSHFMGGFKFDRTANGGVIVFWRIKCEINGGKVDFNIQEKSIDISHGSIHVTDFDGTRSELDLNNIVSTVKDFLSPHPVRTVYDLHELHLFLSWLVGITQDAERLNIVGELISPIRNKVNNAGFEYMHKAICCLLCMLKFPSISTVALTKNMMFLSDLIMNCDMPPSSEMKEKRVTAPLDIFNDLTKSYLRRISNEISMDNNSVKEHVFRPSDHTPDMSPVGDVVLTDKSKRLTDGQELPIEAFDRSGKQWNGGSSLTIKVRDQGEFDKVTGNRLAQSGRGERGGKSGVIAAVSDGSITKYIYDRLRTFDDYQKLIKYFKLYDCASLADLMKKYDINYLIHFIDIAYWREKMDDREFDRLSKIITDFVLMKTVEKQKMHIPIGADTSDKLDYSMMEQFDFTIYDDSISMLESMKGVTSSSENLLPSETAGVDMFDRSRYFDKIREWKKLKNFHDSLVAQYRLLESSGLEKDSSYHKFVNKYEWLENNAGYDGPIRVQLLRTMSDFMKEGHIMMSSQAQYGSKVSQGIYLIARLIDTTENNDTKEAKRFTIGFTVDRYGFLEFDQLKEYKNAQASDRIKAEVRKWLKVKDITYDERTTDIRFRNS